LSSVQIEERAAAVQKRIEQLEQDLDVFEVRVSLTTCDLDTKLQCVCCHALDTKVETLDLMFGTQWTFEGKIHMLHQKPCLIGGLLDSGASVSALVSENFVQRNKLQVFSMERKYNLRLAEGTVVQQEGRMAQVTLEMGERHVETLWCLVAAIKEYDILLGQPWLEEHDPTMQPKSRTLTFQSDKCRACCNRSQEAIVMHCGRVPKATRFRNSHSEQMDIFMVSAYSFKELGKKEDHQTIAMWPHHWEALEDKEVGWAPPIIDTAAISLEDYDKFFQKLNKQPLTRNELLKLIPKQYHDYVDRWNPQEANKLPPRRPGIDHAIELTSGAVPPAKKPYGLTREQAAVVKAYVEDMLGKGFIRPSSSPYAAPVLIVKKPDGELRICVDYRALNALTIKDRNAPPLIQETMTRLGRAAFFTKLDIIAAFNEIRIREGDEAKTAFLTRYGLYEYLVTPFGLCNAPGTFQRLINSTLQEFLDNFCTAYMDDILIYSETEEEHTEHVRKVLEKLRQANLFVDIKKCEFHVKTVKYLGLIISTEGISMDPAKVETIKQWQRPKCMKDVQQFLGFANFYRRFIRNYSNITKPLVELTKAENRDFLYPWRTDSSQHHAFESLKAAFTTAPILAHFDPDAETWLETDASDFIAAAVLSQKSKHDGLLRPVAFLSHKMSPAECNYEIYDKELLAIVRAFEEWHAELAGTADSVKVLTDHKNLQYFMSTKQLNRRQARWAEFLAEFNFIIAYRPGKQGTKPDSLTRRPGDAPEDPKDPRFLYQRQTVLKDKNLEPGMRAAIDLAAILIDQMEMAVAELAAQLYSLSEESDEEKENANEDVSVDSEDEICELTSKEVVDPEKLVEEILKEYPTDDLEKENQDEVLRQILSAKREGARRIPRALIKQGIRIELGNCTIDERGALFVGGRLYVPEGKIRAKVIRAFHDTLSSGHAGRSTTYARVSRHYYWPGMTSTIAKYIKACRLCHWSSAYHEGKHGLLKPLPIPNRYWEDISMDFVTELPVCKRYGRNFKHILVVVDRLSKIKRFIAMDSMDAEAVTQAFIEWIWRSEGYPRSIVSDRGSQFVSHFWKRLCQRLGTKPKLSTAFHPETDGQTERANLDLKQYLRAYVNYNQDNWVDLLPMAEFEANSAPNESTKIEPFVATKGYLPRAGVEPPPPKEPGMLSSDAKREIQKADLFAERMAELRDVLKNNLAWARAKQAEFADKKRLPAPEIRIGDKVFLDGRNIKTQRPNPALESRNLGPFVVTKVIDNAAYELDLPASMKIHNVFHPWLLHLADTEPIPGQEVESPGPIEVDPDGEMGVYYAEEVVDSKIFKRRKDKHTGKQGLLMYKVKYEGYEEWNQNPDWQPYWDLADCPNLIADFHHKYPDKDGPHPNFRTSENWEPIMATIFAEIVRSGGAVD
jgi:transposase InsO family protein